MTVIVNTAGESDEREKWHSRLAEYLEGLGALGRAQGTIDNNKTVLTRWVEHALSYNESPDKFDAEMVEAFLDTLNLTSNSRDSYNAQIRSWSLWSQSLDVRAWVVRAGASGKLGMSAQHNLDNNVVSISFQEYGNIELDSFATRDDLGAYLNVQFPERNNNSARDKLWRFFKDIQINDLVVMPREKQSPDSNTKVAIGRVVGAYRYEPAQDPDVRRRRSVEWIRTDILKGTIKESLLRSINRQGTVNSLKKHDAPYRILCLAEKGQDPGERRQTGDDSESEIWERRLTEYLEHLRTDRSYKDVTISTKDNILGRWITYALAHGHSPVVLDKTALRGFLDNPKFKTQKTRNSVFSHVKVWSAYWDKVGSPADRSLLQKRLEEAANDLLVDAGFLEEIVGLLEDKQQVVLYGPPGTGKTFLAQRLAEALAPEDSARSLVQFHPAYSYEDFFEGYRPVVDDSGQMTYELMPGPLANLAKGAEADPGQRHVMVIDEINRANLPRVLGELLFLFEYRDKSIQVMHRPNESFRLPKNLWFIATMNTADRSIALIDAAMRRRFHFVPFFPETGPMAGMLRKWTTRKAPAQTWIADLLSAVNRELKEDLGEHLQIGPSHFMKPDMDLDRFERVWKYNIEPFIEDQLFGQTTKIERFRLKSVLRRHGPRKADSESGETPDEPDEGTGNDQNDDDGEPSNGRE